jgi:hypothetical protein
MGDPKSQPMELVTMNLASRARIPFEEVRFVAGLLRSHFLEPRFWGLPS